MPTARPRFRLRTRGKGRLRANRERRRPERGHGPRRLLRERRGRGIGGARLDRPGRFRLAHRTLGVDAGARIDGFLADGANRPGCDRDMPVLLTHGVHPFPRLRHLRGGTEATPRRPKTPGSINNDPAHRRHHRLRLRDNHHDRHLRRNRRRLRNYCRTHRHCDTCAAWPRPPSACGR